MKIADLMVAFLTAAATPALIVSVCLSGYTGAYTSPAEYFSLFLPAFVFVFWIALMHCLLLGIPVFIILSRRGAIRWTSILISSFIIGALPFTLLDVIASGQLTIENTFIFGVMGLSGGIMFGLLWR